jgi:cytochrome P450
MILTDDPDIIRYMTAPRSRFRRGHWYRGMGLDPRINNTLSEQDEKRHNELRAKLLPGVSLPLMFVNYSSKNQYTGKDVPSLESRVDARVQELVNVMQAYSSETRLADFAHLSQYLALDVLTDIAFGQPFGFLSQRKDLFEYIKQSARFLPLMEIGTNHPWIHKIMTSRIVSKFAAPKPTDQTGLGAVIGVAQRIINERFSNKSDSRRSRDMLDSFIERGLTQLEAESESLLQILAGADSAATCMRMTLLYLLTKPVAYSKLKKEVEEAIRGNRVTFPIIQNGEATALPYLQACIKESLRMWVPLNGLNTKVAPAEGVDLKGIHIPGGTQVAHAHHSMMRRQEIFGRDAAVFRPERWFEPDQETLRKRERVWELSFSHGRFACL